MECLPRKELQELGDKTILVANLKQFHKALQKYQEHCTSILEKMGKCSGFSRDLHYSYHDCFPWCFNNTSIFKESVLNQIPRRAIDKCLVGEAHLEVQPLNLKHITNFYLI